MFSVVQHKNVTTLKQQAFDGITRWKNFNNSEGDVEWTILVRGDIK